MFRELRGRNFLKGESVTTRDCDYQIINENCDFNLIGAINEFVCG